LKITNFINLENALKVFYKGTNYFSSNKIQTKLLSEILDVLKTDSFLTKGIAREAQGARGLSIEMLF